MARLWLAGYLQDEIAERVGVDQATFMRFCKSAEMHKSLGWRTDPEFTDIDPPLYDMWRRSAKSTLSILVLTAVIWLVTAAIWLVRSRRTTSMRRHIPKKATRSAATVVMVSGVMRTV